MQQASPLRVDLYNAPAIPSSERLPDGSIGLWQPTVVTLISGRSSAVLVDTLFTTSQSVALGDWLESALNGKKLSTIYITHGHGDHWFNVAYLMKRFPGVSVVATQESIDHMSTQLTPFFRQFWHDLFPGQIEESSFDILAQPLTNENQFELEGHVFKAIGVGHSDCDGTSFLHCPSLNMVVAGDIVYNDVHMWMTESTSQSQRDEWIRALEKIQSYDPAIVIGSHHKPGAVDGAWNVTASKEYINTFSKLVQECRSPQELYQKILEAYPDRFGKLVLWTGCKAQYPSQ